jgi:hypothetical protein
LSKAWDTGTVVMTDAKWVQHANVSWRACTKDDCPVHQKAKGNTHLDSTLGRPWGYRKWNVKVAEDRTEKDSHQR